MYGYLQNVKTNVSNAKRNMLKVSNSIREMLFLRFFLFFIGITPILKEMRGQPTLQHDCSSLVFYHILTFVTIPYQILFVTEIRNSYSVTDNMQLLYESNLPLIKKFIRPYTAYEPMEDLLQEAYFGLSEAVKHYETSENVLFMSYAGYWIKQSVQRYLEKSGSTVRIPSRTRQKMARYKKTVQELEQELGRIPTDNEIADRMCISVGLLPELKMKMHGVASLDTPSIRPRKVIEDIIAYFD